MSDNLKKQRYDGWRGGLFTGPGLSFGEAANLRTEGATKENLLEATNCVIDEFGAVTGRPGIVCGAAAPDYTSEILDFIAENAGGGAANIRFLSLANKTIVSELLNVVTVINTYANGGRGQFICFNGRYVHSNGRDAMQAWLPAAAATANALGAPLSRVLHIHNNRVFAANGDVLYETAPGTGPSDVVDNFATGATWTIRGTSNDSIVGLGSIDRDLYIFKSKTIHIQTGFTVNERQTRQFSKYYGCLSPDSIKTVTLKGVGEAIIFLSDNGKLCAIFGGSVHEIGEAVEATTTTINLEANTYEASMTNVPFKHEARAVVSPYGYYILGFNNSTGGGLPSLFKNALVMHLECPFSSQFGTRWPFTLWANDTATEASTYPISFGNLGIDRYIFPINVACGQVTTTGAERYFAFTNSNKNDVDGTLAVADRTFPVRPRIKTINDNCGSDEFYKNFFELMIYASTVDALFSFTMTETVDLNSTPIAGDSITSLGATAQVVTPIGYHLLNDARRVSITLTLVLSNQKVHSLEVRYTRGASV